MCVMALSVVVTLPWIQAGAGAVPPQMSNWAVLVSTSRFWYNYRHEANVLSIYHSVRRLGRVSCAG